MIVEIKVVHCTRAFVAICGYYIRQQNVLFVMERNILCLCTMDTFWNILK